MMKKWKTFTSSFLLQFNILFMASFIMSPTVLLQECKQKTSEETATLSELIKLKDRFLLASLTSCKKIISQNCLATAFNDFTDFVSVNLLFRVKFVAHSLFLLPDSEFGHEGLLFHQQGRSRSLSTQDFRRRAS